MGPVDMFFFSYMVLHVPITLLLDAQQVLPSSLYPAPLQNLLQWYKRSAGDQLLISNPPFLQALVFAEIFFQLPLLILNAYALHQGKAWGKTTGLIYGVHTATTMIPILGHILALGLPNTSLMLAIYTPYLIIPFLLAARVLAWPLDGPKAPGKRRKDA